MQSPNKRIRVLLVDNDKSRWDGLNKAAQRSNPKPELHWAMDFDSAKLLLKKHQFHMILLDCDLRHSESDPEESGNDVAHFILENKIQTLKVVTHDTVAAKRAEIYMILHDHGYEVEQYPYGWLMDPNQLYNLWDRHLPNEDPMLRQLLE